MDTLQTPRLLWPLHQLIHWPISLLMHTEIIGSVSTSYILHGPGDPARVDQALACVPVALTLYCSLPPIHIHLEDLSAASEGLLMALPLSGPLSTAQQTEIFTELLQASQYLIHFKFKHWAQAVQLLSLSETLWIGFNNVKANGTHSIFIHFKSNDFLSAFCKLKRWLVIKPWTITQLASQHRF